jgi:hypothetical protein
MLMSTMGVRSCARELVGSTSKAKHNPALKFIRVH